MRCPKCDFQDSKVIDSRVHRDGTSIRRRRECLNCGNRFSTSEEMLREGLVIVKRDGRREEFDQSKMMTGIHRACEKRPVDVEQLNMMANDILDSLEERNDLEIPSSLIGEKVMEHLKRIDKIAYVRFASVYKDFRDINEFMEEISNLTPRV